MSILTNGEDSDDDAAFHQGLHWLIRQKQTSKKFQKYIFISNYKLLACEHSICSMDYPKFNVSNQKEESNSA